MKPDKFDGKGSFESFLNSFENCARYNRWEEEDRIAHLRWSLTGMAAQLLWDSEGSSYGQLVDRLRSRFGGTGMEEKFQCELRCRRRNRGESIRELAHDIRRLMTLAYPGERSSLAEHIARDAFLAALDDAEFELRIREREPLDLETAVRYAQRYEVFRTSADARMGYRQRIVRQIREEPQSTDPDESNASAGSRPMKDDVQETTSKGRGRNRGERAGSRQSDVVCAVAAERGGGSSSAGEEILQRIRGLEEVQTQMRGEMARIVAINDALGKELCKLQLVEQQRSIPRLMDQRPVVRDQQRQSDGRPSRRASGTCCECGERGHFARNCPSRRASNAHDQPARDAEQFVICSATSASSDKVRAYLKAKVDGRCGYYCLLDSGSDLTLLPESVVDESAIQPTTQKLRAANGTSIEVLGQATVSVSFDDISTEVTGIVTRNVADVVLGMDWLSKYHVTWPFSEDRIVIRGQSVDLHVKEPGGYWCRRVVPTEQIVAPSRSEKLLSTATNEFDFSVRRRTGRFNDNVVGMSRHSCPQRVCRRKRRPVGDAFGGPADESSPSQGSPRRWRSDRDQALFVPVGRADVEELGERLAVGVGRSMTSDVTWTSGGLSAEQRADPATKFTTGSTGKVSDAPHGIEWQILPKKSWGNGKQGRPRPRGVAPLPNVSRTDS